MQEQDAQHRITMSAQATAPKPSTEAKTSNPKTSNATQKGIHRGSRRQVKHEKGGRNNATGEPAVASPVEPGLAFEVKHVIQEDASKTVVTGLEGIQSPVNPSQTKKPKPRPSKAERARRRAAKAAEAAEALTPNDGLNEEATVTKVSTLGSAPSIVSPTQNSLAKNPQSKAVASKRAPVQVSASASNPTHKPPPRTTHANSLARKTAWMFKETTGTPVRTISTSSLLPHATQVSSKAGFSTLCSYNWQHDGSIYVPGSPPKWTPPALPMTLAQDSGRHFIDQNASRVPKYPFEPAFRALSLMNAHTSLNDADIIANRNSLRKLLDFCAGKRLDPFCMGLHMIGKTLVISRKERSAQYMIHGAPNAGFGHSFERGFTRPDNGMDNSSGHHRVIRYHMGALDCVVRFEVDAYYDGEDGDAANEHPSDMTDELAANMAKLAVADIKPPPQSRRKPKSNPANEPTTAIQKGTFISPTKLAEIKAKRLGRLADAMPQLWFGRTPYFINGNHEKGTVHSVSVAHAEAGFGKWEEANQERLRKVVGLLEEIKEVVGGLREGKGILVHDVKGGELKVFQGKGGGVLPGDVVEKYWSL
ncbi:geranylgeranyl pyrophosphate synthetase [Stemphylium lycopersici]|uniref:Geranylgeranyl pyrophosphate synthetase n=1 Tax=Stemphylium lycopersici TaxID=183478 RepID=A0A364N935_STELY|nr:geranylgeranyl pyrophosphate synthetase [Stemphylium lycopersici]